MKITKIDRNACILCDLSMLRYFSSLIMDQRLPNRRRHSIQGEAEAFYRRGGGDIVHFSENEIATAEFYQRANG